MKKPGALSLIEISAYCNTCPIEEIVAQISKALPLSRGSLFFSVHLFAGVDGFIAVGRNRNAGGALLGGRIHRFEKDLKSEFFILFNHF